MQYHRLFGARIMEMAQSFPCVVVSGARQVGKTTLLKALFPDHQYVSLDLPSLAEEAENAPDLFLQKYHAPLLIDEVQYAPALFRHLKSVIDKDRHKMGQFILTGSQKFILMKEVSDSLAGRAAIVDLENLSLEEIRQKNKSNDDWAALLSRGFFPELWRNPKLNTLDFYSSYLATYLERDVRQILNVSSLRDFERFIRACAARSAQMLSFSDLGRDIGIKSETARQWISVLQASNQITLLEPYFENISKRIVKTPKLYFNDTGLLCFLLGFDAEALRKSPLSGSIWETFVFSELRKFFSLNQPHAKIWFYRDAQALEVDFVISVSGRFDLIEAKWTESPDKKWGISMQKAAENLSHSKINSLRNQWILCRTPTPYPLDAIRVGTPHHFFEEYGI
jgi:uncharacterized protein